MAKLSDEERCDQPWADCDDVLAERNRLRAELAALRERLPQDWWERAMVAERDLATARKERDEAIAHDRQPYPTAWAYEQACKALEKTKAENVRARALLAAIRREECLHDRMVDAVDAFLAGEKTDE